jgi:hypothetical protein
MDKTWIDLIELGLKVIVIFGAGIWAFAVLRLLRKDDSATVLARDSEARIRELELRAKSQPAVAVDIRPTITRALEEDGYIITAVVELANRGSQNTKINWKDEPPAFHARLAKFDADGKPKYDPPARFRVPLTFNPKSGAISHVIRAGATESIPFAFKVPSAGLYLLSFRGSIDGEERAEAERLGLPLPEAWTGNKYVLVGEG